MWPCAVVSAREESAEFTPHIVMDLFSLFKLKYNLHAVKHRLSPTYDGLTYNFLDFTMVRK